VIQRVIKPGLWACSWGKNVEVVAERVDCDSPIVHLRFKDGASEQHLSDCDVIDLIDRLKRALSILPTSK
jgi:hypothetical protein